VNIDRVSQNLASGAYGLRGKRTGEAADPSGVDQAARREAPASGDGLSLSEQGRSLSRAQAAVRAAPDVREALVERLRQQVQSGTYQPKDEEIARLLAEGANE
jgi:flagellar biosynthesis anti-sigma factor FlgM